jgi:hypothetical protein
MSSRIEEDQLIARVRDRALDPATRTDYLSERHREMPAPATPDAIHEAEARLGFALHPLHRRLLEEVADGGFGPGDGIVGLDAGGADAHGRSLVELRDVLWLDENTPLPAATVPLCDWGDSIWSCLDTRTAHVLTLDESGLTDTGRSLHSWFADWVSGISLFGSMFIFEERVMINPFTKQLINVRTPAGAIGVPYKRTE